jgi:hypothetical protein
MYGVVGVLQYNPNMKVLPSFLPLSELMSEVQFHPLDKASIS